MKGTYRERHGHRELQASRVLQPGMVEVAWRGGAAMPGGWRAASCSSGLGLHCQGRESLAAESGKQSARRCVGIKGGVSASGGCRLKEMHGGAREIMLALC